MKNLSDNENRTGVWIINSCIVIAMGWAWAAEKWPFIAPYSVAAIVGVTAISLGVLCAAKYKERQIVVSQAKTAEEPATAVGEWLLQTMVQKARMTPASQERLEEINAYAQYKKRILELYSESAESDEMVFARSRTGLKYYRHHRIHRQAASSREYHLDPQSENYSVTIGAVQIEIKGNDTRIVLKDSKNVSVETSNQEKIPITTETGLPLGDFRRLN